MRVLIVISVGMLLLNPVWARPAFRGPLPQEQKDIIQYLAEHHRELRRQVTLTDKGYAAVTTSENPIVVEKLKTHFDYMEKRLGSGAMVRRWDPAFVEMVSYYDQLESEITPLSDGMKITVTGKTPEAVLVAQNHARIVTGFVGEGQSAVQQEHPAVIPVKIESP